MGLTWSGVWAGEYGGESTGEPWGLSGRGGCPDQLCQQPAARLLLNAAAPVGLGVPVAAAAPHSSAEWLGQRTVACRAERTYRLTLYRENILTFALPCAL